jgi:hypothetical protein
MVVRSALKGVLLIKHTPRERTLRFVVFVVELGSLGAGGLQWGNLHSGQSTNDQQRPFITLGGALRRTGT